MTKRQQFLGYAHAFLVAADGHATAAKEKGIDGEVDGMMEVVPSSVELRWRSGEHQAALTS